MEQHLKSLSHAFAVIDKLDLPLMEEEIVSVPNAYSRVLASEIRSSFPHPPFRSSSMDGYAIRTSELNIETSNVFFVQGRSTLAEPFASLEKLPPLSCIEVSTGAYVPYGFDSVCPVELVALSGLSVQLKKNLLPGDNIREVGQEFSVDAKILSTSTVVGAGCLSILTSQGLQECHVRRRPRVEILTTGSEFGETTSSKYPTYNSSAPMLSSLIRGAGGVARSVTSVDDEMGTIRTELSNVVNGDADLLVTTGGISAGAVDLLPHAFEELGVEILFRGLRMRPGHPTMLGRVHRNGSPSLMILSLPGNPLSTFVSWRLFGSRILRAMLGLSKEEFFEARCEKPHAPTPGWTFVRFGDISFSKGEVYFYPMEHQASFMQLPLTRRAICLLGFKDLDEQSSLVPVLFCREMFA